LGNLKLLTTMAVKHCYSWLTRTIIPTFKLKHVRNDFFTLLAGHLWKKQATLGKLPTTTKT